MTARRSKRIARSVRTAVATIGTVVGLAAAADAQYFGQNKVRYEDLQFSVLRTRHFDIYYYAQEERSIDEAARLAERWHARLASVLDHELRGRQPLVMYANHPDFQQTRVIGGSIGPSTGGVTEQLQRRMVLPFTGSLEDTSHVLGHELVHAFQFDIAHGPGASALPLWFVEGMAEYLSVGPLDTQTAAWLRDAVIHDDLPGFEDLGDPRYFPYRFGHAAWAFLAGTYGDAIVGELFRRAAGGQEPLQALEQLTERPLGELSAAWHASIRRAYGPLPLTEVGARGRTLISDERDGGTINIGPALSPDGRRLAFLSERSLLSIDLFVADVATGEVVRKLTDVATDGHLSNIQFLQSSGSWAPDGRRFAYAAVAASTPILVIVDTDSGEQLREVRFDDLGEIVGPKWSPDGRSIVFSGMQGGGSDLFVYDLDRNRLDRLTNDLYAQLQPSWSPDGTRIAFVTDQFSTDLRTLDFGRYRLAIFDWTNRRIRPLGGFPTAAHVDPQWAPDGDGLYFIANPNGIANVFHLTLADGSIEPVTDVSTAVTGITKTTPALAVASQTGDLAYSVFRDGDYVIQTIAGANAGADVPLADVNGAALPPRQRATGRVAELLRQPGLGLPPADAMFPRNPYGPKLSLSYVGASGSTGLGANQFGTFVSGGVTLLFSDVLNYHRVGATVEANGGVKDVGAQLGYLNQTSRWNWGGVLQRIPLRTGAFRQGTTTVDGEQVIVEQQELLRQIDTEASGVAEYPFSRAARVELSAGLRRIAFDREVTTAFISPNTGRTIDRNTRDLDAAPAINLGQASAAYVYDTTALGPTSPLLGTRARLEVTPTIGDVQWTEVLFDYRRYLSPIPAVTIAGRALHFGRYGGGGDDPRLSPLFVGYPNLVRGYDVDTFSLRDCRADGRFDCPDFEELLGTRLAVANLEVRVPLPGIFRGTREYWQLPIEAFAFADSGVAWTATERPALIGGTRALVSSVGAGARVNLAGYLITEFNAAKAVSRDRDDWRFVFNIRPGF